MQKFQNSSIDLRFCADYYKTPGARDLSHRLKANNAAAISKIAAAMAPSISPSASLIPVPSRFGYASTSLQLAHAISKLTGCVVCDVLQGKPRHSHYILKKKGLSLSDDYFRLDCIGSYGANPLLIDCVYDTGRTMGAAIKAIPEARAMVFAKVTN